MLNPPSEIRSLQKQFNDIDSMLISIVANLTRTLSPIEFLRPAIDIPYCHHEKWHGTGYPRGLKGMQIPFAARIFPVIDVWDALVSNRPYRQGLPHDEVRARIKADSGKHFDPHDVKAFMELEDLSVS